MPTIPALDVICVEFISWLRISRRGAREGGAYEDHEGEEDEDRAAVAPDCERAEGDDDYGLLIYGVGFSTDNLLRGEWAQREREGWWWCVPSAMNSPNATDPVWVFGRK